MDSTYGMKSSVVDKNMLGQPGRSRGRPKFGAFEARVPVGAVVKQTRAFGVGVVVVKARVTPEIYGCIPG